MLAVFGCLNKVIPIRMFTVDNAITGQIFLCRINTDFLQPTYRNRVGGTYKRFLHGHHAAITQVYIGRPSAVFQHLYRRIIHGDPLVVSGSNRAGVIGDRLDGRTRLTRITGSAVEEMAIILFPTADDGANLSRYRIENRKGHLRLFYANVVIVVVIAIQQHRTVLTYRIERRGIGV